MLHELAHITKHLISSDRVSVDARDLRVHDNGSDDSIELEADEMAREGLIPKKEWEANPIKGRATASIVIALADKLKIHPAIIAGRVRYERNNYRLLSKYVGNKEVCKHFDESCPMSEIIDRPLMVNDQRKIYGSR